MITVPDTLTHYYRTVSRPFRSLTSLSVEEAADVVERLAALEPLPRRLSTPHYLPRRRLVEEEMRAGFQSKGGRPRRSAPHYLILGTWSHWERADGFASVSIPLSAVDPQFVSFTYPDSWVSFVGQMLSGAPLPRFPYHGQVFRLDELDGLIQEFGLPGDRWQTEAARQMETYIEAQIWDDAIVNSLAGA